MGRVIARAGFVRASAVLGAEQEVRRRVRRMGLDSVQGGARASRCSTMAAMTRGSVMCARTRSAAPQRGQRLKSNPKARCSRCIQPREVLGREEGGDIGSGSEGWTCSGTT